MALSAEQLRARALSFEKEKRYTDALTIYAKCLADDPTDLAAMKRCIGLRRAAGEQDSAHQLLVQVLSTFPVDTEAWLEAAGRHQALIDDIRVFDGAQNLRDARAMRHSVPATMNERGAVHRKNGGRKVSTDWAVPYARLADALAVSRDAVERHGAPPAVTYGHAGNGHPHQNFIAEDAAVLGRINAAVEDTLRSVIQMGGTVSAEHGLGKIKQAWIGLQLSARQIAVMRAIKNALDPAGVFAPGNVL